MRTCPHCGSHDDHVFLETGGWDSVREADVVVFECVSCRRVFEELWS